MADGSSISDLLARIRAHDDEACREVVQRFTARLVALARRRLGERLQRKEDPEDVLQSALRSFFHRCELGQFEFASWGDLWSLLVAIVVRKCANRRAHYAAGKRDVRNEADAFRSESDSNVDPVALIADREPMPEEAVLIHELIERLLEAYDDADRAAVELMLQGFTVVDVSERLGRAERTLRRLRSHVEQRLVFLSTENAVRVR